jgi:hypothetical protein
MTIALDEFVDAATIAQPARAVDVSLGMRPADFDARPAQPSYNGTRFFHDFVDENGRAQHPIFLVDQGYARHISDPATYNALFRNWEGIVGGGGAQALWDLLPVGSPLQGAALERGIDDSRTVWLIDFMGRRHIANPHTMDVYYFSWDRIYTVPDIGLNQLAIGPEISA